MSLSNEDALSTAVSAVTSERRGDAEKGASMQSMVTLAQEGGGSPGPILVVLILIAAAVLVVYRVRQSSKEETSESRTIQSLPPSIQHVVSQMDGESQNAFFNEYERKKKKKSVGWIAWFFLGWHYLYVGKVGVQFAFWFTGGWLVIGYFVDFFRMPSIIRSANEQIARDAIQTLGTMASFGRAAAPPDLAQPQEGGA